MEHLQHFGLGRDPFVNDPLPELFFESPEHVGAERRLQRALAQRKGLCLLLGDPGSGKTMIVRRLLEQLEEEVFDVSLLVPLKGVADSKWILTRFARQLEVRDPAPERATLLAQIYEQLAIIREDGRHAVLIVDESQVVADPDVLQEIRGLLNLEYENRHLLSLVLVGLPDLERAVARETSLAGRVDVKVRLEPLDPSTAVEYLAHRIRNVEGDPSVFGADAVRSLVHHAAGNPRLLNTLADNALYEAYLAGRRPVAAADCEKAARDLDPQATLPPPLPATTEVERPAAFSGPAQAPAAERQTGTGTGAWLPSFEEKPASAPPAAHRPLPTQPAPHVPPAARPAPQFEPPAPEAGVAPSATGMAWGQPLTAEPVEVPVQPAAAPAQPLPWSPPLPQPEPGQPTQLVPSEPEPIPAGAGRETLIMDFAEDAHPGPFAGQTEILDGFAAESPFDGPPKPDDHDDGPDDDEIDDLFVELVED